MNRLFPAIILIAFLTAAVRQYGFDGAGGAPMDALAAGLIEAAKGAIDLALGLIGVMAFFLGLMRIVEAGGLLRVMAKLLRPLLVRLFPDVPPDHPAMGAIVMNLSSNALGLGNAATPFGVKAMQELDALNPVKGAATNAMALFLAINASAITLLPTGVIGLRAALGSKDPAGIMPTTLFATLCSTATAIVMAKLLERRFPARGAKTARVEAAPATGASPAVETGAYPLWASALALLGFLAIIPGALIWGREISPWIIPALTVSFVLYGVVKKIPVYEVFIEGAKDGFQVAVRIIPYLVAILTAVGMFRVSGAMDLVVKPLGAMTAPLGMPAEALPMAILRPMSGTGAYGVMAAILRDPAIGPDSYTGYLVSTLQGSTETTFYVLAVYFGAVGVRRFRHTLIAALCADLAGTVGAVVSCNLLYGGG